MIKQQLLPSYIQRGNIPNLNVYLVLCRCSSKIISKTKCIEIICLNANRYKFISKESVSLIEVLYLLKI